MNDLEAELKSLIIESLELEDITVADIASDAALFGGDLGLDSIDALELGVVIQKKYKISIDAESSEDKSHFSSVASLASFIQQQLQQ